MFQGGQEPVDTSWWFFKQTKEADFGTNFSIAKDQFVLSDIFKHVETFIVVKDVVEEV
jgi:hypothetical protein